MEQELIDLDINKIPKKVIKLITDLDVLRIKINDNKRNGDELYHSFNTLDKTLSRFLNKQIKTLLKKKEKKPRGFAIPTYVSSVLCEFMEQPHNSKISRTSATAYLMAYIKTHQLFDPNHKKIIVPDDKLWTLLGDEAREEDTLDRFNIQRFLNKHFSSISNQTPFLPP